MAGPRSGFQAQPSQGSRADFSGDDNAKKGDAKRKVLAAMLRMLSETQLKNRQQQKMVPENPEVGAPQDRDSPEAIAADTGGQQDAPVGVKRKGKSASMYGAGKQQKTVASHSKPQGVPKGSKYG